MRLKGLVIGKLNPLLPRAVCQDDMGFFVSLLCYPSIGIISFNRLNNLYISE